MVSRWRSPPKPASTNYTSFDEDLTITFYYTSSQLGSTDADALGIYYWDDDDDSWVSLTSTVSSSGKKVTARTDHFTVFALLADTTAVSVPTLSNGSTATTTAVTLTGKAEKNARVEIMLNGSTVSATANSSGNFSKDVTLITGRNEIKLRARDAAGNQSSWSKVYTINCTPVDNLQDIGGHWAEQNIRKIAQQGIAKGFEDNTFRPDQTITRAEFCKFVVAALDYSEVSNPQLSFKDASSIPTWARGAVAKAVQEGIISGYSDNTFRASLEITREEMASILIRAMDLQSDAEASKNSHLQFKDAGQIQSWARGAVAVAVQKGLISGYTDNTFGPKRKASRAEAATMIVKMQDLI